MVNIILNNYVQAESEEDIKMYLSVLNLLIEYPYQDEPDDRRLKLVQRILTETYFRSSSKSYVLREIVMELFINWSQMKDLYVRQHLQVLHCDSENNIRLLTCFFYSKCSKYIIKYKRLDSSKCCSKELISPGKLRIITLHLLSLPVACFY